MNIIEPDCNLLKKVLKREPTDRPVLFEYFMNQQVYDYFTRGESFDNSDGFGGLRQKIMAFSRAGYDYVTVLGSDYKFPQYETSHASSISQSGPGIITDSLSYEAYIWPDPDKSDYSRLEKLSADLPSGMTFMAESPDGILESAVNLIGYETLCIMLLEERSLVKEIFDQIGSRLLKYYKNCLKYKSVGLLMVNDDWGFYQQTLIRPDDLREFVFPWQKRIVDAAHSNGVPAILHSCGNLAEVWEDIIEYMRFDGKHSYEDKILPVEQAYEMYGNRIAILGGMDLDFICRSEPESIRRRVKKILEKTGQNGGYAVGTGNSVPEYVPLENYLAMIDIFSV